MYIKQLESLVKEFLLIIFFFLYIIQSKENVYKDSRC